MEVRGAGEFLNDSDGATGKVAEIGRIETRDCPINSWNSDELCLSSGITSSKSVEQHGLPLSDGTSASPAAPVLGLWQQIE
ncbi:MAG: hypothetical protein OXU36_21420 [Candidatus Poribacteria bacterium]|nr:hypothetical protein [Candidatus Poribacteria bacterium]